MSTTIISMKTYSRRILDMEGRVNNCIIHNCQPTALEIVAGKAKEKYLVLACVRDQCGKIATDTETLVAAWNKDNPKTRL